MCVCMHVCVCLYVRVCTCVCVCVCESPMINDYNFKVGSLEDFVQFLSVHLINNICVHVLIFLWLFLNHTVVR